MKILRKITIFMLIILMIVAQVQISANQSRVLAASNIDTENKNTIDAGVLLYSFDDLYMSQIKQNLEDIQKNKNRVNFTFFDSKYNPAIQNEILNSLFNSNFRLLILNLINPNKDVLTDVINKAKQKGISLIIFNIDPANVSQISGLYNKVAFITTDSKQLGTLQGKILIDEWNSNKNIIDKNNDNVLQYIVLEGDPSTPFTKERTDSSISEIKNAGIKTQELDHKTAFWDRDLAEIATEPLLLKYNGTIEAIISNNDSMAIGAVSALQKYGYDKGDKSKYIPVVGIDGLPEARNLIDKGMMTGTVSQALDIVAESIYNVGINLASNENPQVNENYKFINGNIVITAPYQIYTK